MRRASGAVLLMGLLAAACTAPSPATHAAAQTVAAAAPAQPLKPSPEFAQFPRYAGTLGKRAIVLRLGAKTDDPQGVHGEYQYADTGQVILVAGDRNGATLEVEESDDGTQITGNWVGTFAADGTLSGERMDVDDSNPVPFALRPERNAAQSAAAPHAAGD